MKTILYMVVAGLLFFFVIKISKDLIPSDNELQGWAKSQIQEDIAVFEKNHKITSRNIDYAYKDLLKDKNNLLLRFQIFDGKLYSNYQEIDRSNDLLVKSYRVFYKFFTAMLSTMSDDVNADFIISVGDDLHIGDDYVFKAPIISGVRNKNKAYAKFLPLAPDHYTISDWSRLYNDILSSNERYKWSDKISKAFWRGAASSGVYTRSEWQYAPRVKLVDLSVEHPSLLDARFTELEMAQSDPNAMRSISEKYPLAVALTQVDHIKYKIQISMEGFGVSLPGYLWRLLSNSAVLKLQSGSVQWFYPILKEGVHYIPLSYDMTDTIDKIKWCLAHDAESKKIGEDGGRLIEKEITPNHLYLYWSGLLKEYSKLMDKSASATLPSAQDIEQ